MKRKRFTEEQIALALRQAESGTPVAEVCRELNIESFYASFRKECLNVHWFWTLEEAKQKIEQWRKEYNEVRPHSSLGNLTPREFVDNLEQEGTSETEILTRQVV